MHRYTYIHTAYATIQTLLRYKTRLQMKNIQLVRLCAVYCCEDLLVPKRSSHRPQARCTQIDRYTYLFSLHRCTCIHTAYATIQTLFRYKTRSQMKNIQLVRLCAVYCCEDPLVPKGRSHRPQARCIYIYILSCMYTTSM